MDTNTGENTEAVAASAEAAAVATQAAIENVENNAAATVAIVTENAAAAIDAATAAADNIAEAAMETELANRISSLGERFDTWRTATEARLLEMGTSQENLMERLTAALERLAPQPSSSILPVSEETPVIVPVPPAEVEIPQSGNTHDAPSEAGKGLPDAGKRKKTRL